MRISDWSSDLCSSYLDLSPGYPCLLKNAELRIHPGKDNLEAARKCVNQMLAADPDSADALAAAVFVNYGLSAADPDRKSVVEGKSVSVRVDLGGRRIIKKKISQ